MSILLCRLGPGANRQRTDVTPSRHCFACDYRFSPIGVAKEHEAEIFEITTLKSRGGAAIEEAILKGYTYHRES